LLREYLGALGALSEVIVSLEGPKSSLQGNRKFGGPRNSLQDNRKRNERLIKFLSDIKKVRYKKLVDAPLLLLNIQNNQ